jgi:hypothetical protein
MVGWSSVLRIYSYDAFKHVRVCEGCIHDCSFFLLSLSVCAYVYATNPSLSHPALGARWRKTKALGCSSQASKSLKRQPAQNRHGFGPQRWFLACLMLSPVLSLSLSPHVLSHTQHSIPLLLVEERETIV